MALRIQIREGEAPLTITDNSQLDEALERVAEEARTHGMLSAVLIEAENGNTLTMVVGGEETVLGFDDCDGEVLRCYGSRGASDSNEPFMTCYLTMHHYTEFPRKSVIPLPEGVKAVRQFLDSSVLPNCIMWEEI